MIQISVWPQGLSFLMTFALSLIARQWQKDDLHMIPPFLCCSGCLSNMTLRDFWTRLSCICQLCRKTNPYYGHDNSLGETLGEFLHTTSVRPRTCPYSLSERTFPGSFGPSGAFKLILEPARASVLLLTSLCASPLQLVWIPPIFIMISSHYHFLTRSSSTISTLRQTSGTTN